MSENKKKIAVIGIGYVGLSLAILLAQENKVIAVDINEHKVNLINKNQSPLKDREIIDYLQNKNSSRSTLYRFFNRLRRGGVFRFASCRSRCTALKD